MRHLPNYKLIVAGKKETPYGEKVIREREELGLHNQILLPGVISDSDRHWLYENCDAFVFPSLTEGFGFPVLEAMQFGKPVATSNRTSLPEIAGSRGFYFTSYEADHMARTVQEAIRNFRENPNAAEAKPRAANSFLLASDRPRIRAYLPTVLDDLDN